jgi:xanthine dehydrogenase accessory factor
MHKELELWQFIADRLSRNQPVMLLVVATSSGSSPGRQGYKMAVGADGELCGSIGGGVMEVNLVERGRDECRNSHVSKGETSNSFLAHQTHQKNAADSSGMICSGKQTVIFHLLTPNDAETVDEIVASISDRRSTFMTITVSSFSVGPPKRGTPNEDFAFEKITDPNFSYTEKLGYKNSLYIIGGGHCALALSELMSKIDFRISLFDDRPDLNTIEKNAFADEIVIIDTYEQLNCLISSGENNYVVIMTLGYKSDETVIRQLLDKDFKYIGVLGSKAKMTTLMNELKKGGFPANRLDRIHTPIGLPINSRTPEEIAVSIAAQIIAVKNG